MSPFFGYSSTSPIAPGSNRAFAAALASFALTKQLLLLAFLALLLFLLRLLADVAKFVEEPCVSHDSVRKVRACIPHDSVRSVRACSRTQLRNGKIFEHGFLLASRPYTPHGRPQVL